MEGRSTRTHRIEVDEEQRPFVGVSVFLFAPKAQVEAVQRDVDQRRLAVARFRRLNSKKKTLKKHKSKRCTFTTKDVHRKRACFPT